jgi:hypothetical protein
MTELERALARVIWNCEGTKRAMFRHEVDRVAECLAPHIERAVRAAAERAFDDGMDYEAQRIRDPDKGAALAAFVEELGRE